MSEFEYNNVTQCIGDRWKDVTRTPGNDEGPPIRPDQIQAESVTIKDENSDLQVTRMSNKVKQATEWITTDVAVEREEWQ